MGIINKLKQKIMQFAVACLIATASAIRIQNATCPTGSKAASAEGFTFKHEADGCYWPTALSQTCPDGSKAASAEGFTFKHEADGCYWPTALSQTCPDGSKAASAEG